MSEQPQDLRQLAAEFDKRSRERDPLHRVHVIDQHYARPESFKWFVEGVMYERERARNQETGNKPANE